MLRRPAQGQRSLRPVSHSFVVLFQDAPSSRRPLEQGIGSFLRLVVTVCSDYILFSTPHIYPLPPDVVFGHGYRTGTTHGFWPYRTDYMQDLVCELPRRPILGTAVNILFALFWIRRRFIQNSFKIHRCLLRYYGQQRGGLRRSIEVSPDSAWKGLRMEDPLRERRKGCDLELPERLEQELRLGIPVVPLGQLLLTYSKR